MPKNSWNKINQFDGIFFFVKLIYLISTGIFFIFSQIFGILKWEFFIPDSGYPKNRFRVRNTSLVWSTRFFFLSFFCNFFWEMFFFNLCSIYFWDWFRWPENLIFGCLTHSLYEIDKFWKKMKEMIKFLQENVISKIVKNIKYST